MKDKFHEFTDSQWQILEEIIADTRKREHSLRTILNAILWINYTGAQWRNLDSKYPAWQSVYYHFRKFQLTGVWEQILDKLTMLERIRQDVDPEPSLLAADSQSVKKVQFTSLDTGIDRNKKINGRKRTLLVDTLGIPFAVKVTAANVSDNVAGILAVDTLKGKMPKVKKVVGDQGYKTTFKEYVEKKFGWTMEIGQKPESTKGFVPQKDRWQVERSFSWLNFRRRLLRDVEKTIESSEAMLQIAFTSFILNRLTK
jgi:putative transposase